MNDVVMANEAYQKLVTQIQTGKHPEVAALTPLDDVKEYAKRKVREQYPMFAQESALTGVF